ncbi:MAG: threonine ammonia-lyase, biosynthetic [Candidatus Competibacterales bacterium]|nr:threonine ammonia-lyase, biosynthetic [Candidatus Competibacterales bacterium]
MNAIDLQSWLSRARATPVYQVAQRSPLDYCPGLSRSLGRRVWLKREDLQPTYSFKLRGAYAMIAGLVGSGVRHVCAASAGNHAQGVALAAERLGIQATVFMPRTTPPIKVDAVTRLGAQVELTGDTFDQACGKATAFAQDTGATFVHPFDHPDVIAGQGTVGIEILEQCERPPARVFVPVGGGGLIAGLGACIKAQAPGVRIIAVECDEAPSIGHALRAGRPIEAPTAGSFADGIAVSVMGRHTFELASSVVDEVISVTGNQICAAVRDVYTECRAILEPAGATAIAGMQAYGGGEVDEDWVAVASGANVNFDRLGHIVERAELGAGREVLLAARIPEQAGEFLRFCRRVGPHPVTEFNYRYGDRNQAQVLVGVKIDPAGADQLRSRLAESYAIVDLTGDETAHNHVRHMIGGRPALPAPERVFRFEFPERRGALLEFLTRLRGRWSISLFHYRNHGSSFGQVLAGFLVQDEDQRAFRRFLDTTGYTYSDVSDSPAYRLFSAPLATPRETEPVS